MENWLQAAGGEPAVLVTVAIAEGSVPREPGARMQVDAHKATGTIGGGHLELRAIDIARTMLQDGRARHFERFALGRGGQPRRRVGRWAILTPMQQRFFIGIGDGVVGEFHV